MIINPGATSIPRDVQILDDSGLPVTGLVAATFPAVYYSLGNNTAAVQITPLSDLAAITTAFTANGVKERTGSAGYYRLDVPDAAWAAVGRVTIFGEASGKHLVCPPTDVVQLPAADTNGRVDVIKINGTSQTARDLGASVLLSSGTGTGQLSLSAGAVLLQATQTGVTIPTVTTITNGVSVASGGITAGSIASSALTAAKFAAGSITASALAADAGTEIAAAVAASILVTPANKIASDSEGAVTIPATSDVNVLTISSNPADCVNGTLIVTAQGYLDADNVLQMFVTPAVPGDAMTLTGPVELPDPAPSGYGGGGGGGDGFTSDDRDILGAIQDKTALLSTDMDNPPAKKDDVQFTADLSG